MHRTGDEVDVMVEVPKGGLLKRDHLGRLQAVSPIPCPFNYGSVPGALAEDGAPVDAVILGRRLPRGHRGRFRILGVVRFTDAGLCDDKLVVGDRLSRGRVIRILAFFHAYARVKRVLNRLRGRSGETRCEGLSRPRGA